MTIKGILTTERSAAGAILTPTHLSAERWVRLPLDDELPRGLKHTLECMSVTGGPFELPPTTLPYPVEGPKPEEPAEPSVPLRFSRRSCDVWRF